VSCTLRRERIADGSPPCQTIDMPSRWQKLALPAVLMLAFAHGGLYASFLPPWGLVDEQQHFHYIQHLAEKGSIPIAGQTVVSAEIIASLFETRKWENFHSATFSSEDPREMGLDGQSYEGYQPPVFYALFVPLYLAFPGDVVDKLFWLRWASVGLSLVTVWIAYRIVLELFPENHFLAFSTAALLALLPERAAAISRVNNDVLLEVLAAALVWVCTVAVLRRLSIRRCQLLGLLLGLGVLTKTSMAVLVVLLPFVFLADRHDSGRSTCALWTCGIATVLIVPLVARNLSLYGDPTGFSGFEAVYEIPAPALNWGNLLSEIRSLFSHFWVVWWKGARAGTNPLLSVSHAVLAILTAFSLTGLVRSARRARRMGKLDRRHWIAAMYTLAVMCSALAVLAGSFRGMFPVIQGRFFLPVVVPIVILFCWGLWCTPSRKVLILATLLTVTALGVLSLFGNLLPYFYYWTEFVADGVPQPHSWPGWQDAWAIFRSRLLNYKPGVVQSTLAWTVGFYALSLVLAGAVFRGLSLSTRRDHTAEDR
jgi:hypothetical protein